MVKVNIVRTIIKNTFNLYFLILPVSLFPDNGN